MAVERRLGLVFIEACLDDKGAHAAEWLWISVQFNSIPYLHAESAIAESQLWQMKKPGQRKQWNVTGRRSFQVIPSNCLPLLHCTFKTIQCMSVINWHTTSGNQRYFSTGGGTGFIGKALVRSLKQAGHEVTIISRSKAPGRITWVSGIKHFLLTCFSLITIYKWPHLQLLSVELACVMSRVIKNY